MVKLRTEIIAAPARAQCPILLQNLTATDLLVSACRLNAAWQAAPAGGGTDAAVAQQELKWQLYEHTAANGIVAQYSLPACRKTGLDAAPLRSWRSHRKAKLRSSFCSHNRLRKSAFCLCRTMRRRQARYLLQVIRRHPLICLPACLAPGSYNLTRWLIPQPQRPASAIAGARLMI